MKKKLFAKELFCFRSTLQHSGLVILIECDTIPNDIFSGFKVIVEWVQHSVQNQQLSIISVQGPGYLGLISSISWLLMRWLLASPGHHQPCYWPCNIGKYLSYSRKDTKYPCQCGEMAWNVDITFVPSEKFSTEMVNNQWHQSGKHFYISYMN